MQAQQRLDEVAEAEDVEGAGEDGAGDAVGDGEGPCCLGLVDSKVGRDGAVQALLDEDVVAFVLGEGLGCGESVKGRVRVGF